MYRFILMLAAVLALGSSPREAMAATAEEFAACISKAYAQSTWGAVQGACVQCYASVGKGSVGPTSCKKQSDAWCVKRNNYCEDKASQCDVVMSECSPDLGPESTCDPDVGTTDINGQCLCPLTRQPPEPGKKCLALPDSIPTPSPDPNPKPNPTPTPTPTPTPKPNPTPSPAPDSVSAVNQCESAYDRAESACSSGGGFSGGSGSSGKSIAQLCAEWNATGTIAGDTNTSAGSACTSAYRSCVNTCESLADQIGPSNPGAGNELIYIADDCFALGDRAMALGQQGLDSYNSAEMGRMCNENARAQSVGDGPGGNGPKSGRDLLGKDDIFDKKVSDYAKGNAGFADPDDDTGKNFNLDELQDGSRSQRPRASVPISAGGGAAVVPNNSGTGLPADDSNSRAGRSGKDAQKPASGRAAGDVLHGLEASGSGFEGLFRGRDSRERNRPSPGRNVAKAKDPSLDLKNQFNRSLSEALRRRMAGRFYNNSLGIHGAGVDIFGRITERMREKCAMGDLTDCH